jgi:hypothetical protein
MSDERLKTDPAFGYPWFRRPADLAQFKRLGFASVYALGPVSGRPMRVSWALNPKHRFAIVQNSNWKELKLHEILWTAGEPIAHRLEREIKAILEGAGRGLRGDWYDVTDDLIRPTFKLGRQRAGVEAFTHDEMIQRVFDAGERRAGSIARSLGITVMPDQTG